MKAVDSRGELEKDFGELRRLRDVRQVRRRQFQVTPSLGLTGPPSFRQLSEPMHL